MMHPGLSSEWAIALWTVMIMAGVWAFLNPVVPTGTRRHLSFRSIPVIGPFLSTFLHYVIRKAWVLFLMRIVFVGVFLLIIVAGLFGSPFPERNVATVLTWNWWWAGLVLSIFFAGPLWCGFCPWNTMANWLVKQRLWLRAANDSSLGLRVPRWLKTTWPAFLLLVGLTWLELGVGITVDPFGTALLALAVFVAATASLMIFERNAFCHYFCPVGRTVGFYAQLAPVELRPIKSDLCADCTTLECYSGSDSVDPCPTHQVMGTLQQNTYCTSCGNCARSCPHENVTWRLRSPSAEAVEDARPHWDEAWFMIGLLALTGFHGLTMLSSWESGTAAAARVIGESGQMLWTFTGSLVLAMALPTVIYMVVIKIVQVVNRGTDGFADLFCRFAFIALPLAFAYHLSHNLNHLLREGKGLWAVLSNPMGTGTLPADMAEKHMLMMDPLLPPMALQGIQSLLLAGGFIIALRVIQKRSNGLDDLSVSGARMRALPLILFAVGLTGFHLWLLMQPMVMRL